MTTRHRSTSKASQRRMIHRLNQRYHQEFIRAEQLQADLAVVRRLRATWLLRGLRKIRNGLRWLTRSSLRDNAVTPLTMQPVAVDGKVSIIIPFRDCGQLLRDCLASVRHSNYQNYEIILVDNGSRETALLRMLSRLEEKPAYRVIRAAEPFNFSRLCNAGARAASGEWLLFLNNDTAVLSADWIEQMIRTARQPNVGIAGATLYYPDGTIQHGGMIRRHDGVWEHLGRGERETPGEVRVVPAVSAACLMIGRSLFDQLGGFDEARPVTHNDVDLCRRARALGQLVAVTPHARLLHYESLSRGYSLTPPDQPTQQNQPRSGVVGMTSSEEHRYCFDYAAQHYSGRGGLVELGSWMGACTAQMARGLAQNPRREKNWRLDTFDRFRWQSAMEPFVKGTRYEGRFKPGQWFLGAFLEQVAPWIGSVRLHISDLATATWNGTPIEFLLLDALKSPVITQQVAQQFFPALLPGALVLEQDYSHFWTSWIHILHYILRDHFALAKDLTESCGVVFQVTKPLTRDLFDNADWLSCTDPQEVKRAFAWSRKLVAPQKRPQIAAAEVLHWHHVGQPDRLDETLQRHRVAGLLGDNELSCINACLSR